MGTPVTPEEVLQALENLEAFLWVPQAHQLTVQQRQLKVAMLLKDYPETSGQHLAWCVATWMEEAGSSEFRRFPGWSELLGRLYRQINGSGSRSAGYRELPDGLQPAAWQVEQLRYGHHGDPIAAPKLTGTVESLAQPAVETEEEARAFFDERPDHPAKTLYGPLLNRPPKTYGLRPADWLAHLDALNTPPSEPSDPLMVRCQVRLEKHLLAGRTSVAEWNRHITSNQAVLPRAQFLLENPLFQDAELRDIGRVRQKADEKAARDKARQEAKDAAARAKAEAKARMRKQAEQEPPIP